jgi:glycosyltransferase involved in cell wall biosynthesis
VLERFNLALIVPALNEGKTIERVISEIIQYGSVIVVNDGSNDNTRVLALAAGAIVVDHSINLGYDEALNSGFIKAEELGCTHVITMDADGQHNAEIISEYIENLKNGYELVSGIRRFKARFAEKIFSLYAIVRYGFKDPLCGMKGYSIQLYREVGKFSSYVSIGTELALYAFKNKRKTIQLHIPIKKRIDQPRFYGNFKANCIILKALLHDIGR